MSSGFAFDDAEFHAVLRDWRDLRTQLDQVRRRFGTLADLSSRRPADDLASQAFQGRAQRAVLAASASDDAVRAYVDGFIARLEQTAGTYVNTDVDGVTRFDHTDDGGSVTGDPTPG